MKTKSEDPAVPAIKTLAQAGSVVGEITRHTLKLRELEAERDARQIELEESYSSVLADLAGKVDCRVNALQRWAGQHPELFAGKKSLDFPAGSIGYRIGMPELRTRRGITWQQVLMTLKSLRMKPFIRVRETVNKEAILAERANGGMLRQLGLSVAQEQTFYVGPRLTLPESKTVESAATE